jgi:Cupin superfamily protein
MAGAPNKADALLSRHQRLPGLRLVKAKTDIGIETYSPEYAQVGHNLYGTVNFDRVFAEHQAGATIVLEGVHRSWEPLTEFCRMLERTLSHPIQANLYLTPKAAQGFEAHYDTHDVFVVQIAGRKKWRIYPPHVTLPLRSQPYSGDHDPSIKPLQELKLSQGDLLYIPRGYTHEAMTQSNELSVHITVGVIAYTWHDLFQEAVTQICGRDHLFRRSLPVGFANGSISHVANKRQINRLLNQLKKPDIWDKSFGALIDRFVLSREPIVSGHLLDQRQIEKIDLSTVLKIRDDIIFQARRDEGRIVLTFHGKSVHFPDYTAAALHFIVTTRSFHVGSIPDCLDASGKMVLVRRLIKEGFLTIERLRTTPDDL